MTNDFLDTSAINDGTNTRKHEKKTPTFFKDKVARIFAFLPIIQRAISHQERPYIAIDMTSISE